MRTRGAAVVMLTGMLGGGCGLLLGSDDYAVGVTGTGTGGGASSSGSSVSGAGGASSAATTSSDVSSAGTGGSAAHLVAVIPSAITLLAQTTQTFTATIDGAPSSGVTWQVVELMSGSVSKTGAYTAPLIEGTYHLRATSAAMSGEHGDATITVKAAVMPAPIAAAGAVTAATGNGTQSHLAYAAGDGEWWLYYDVPGMPALATMRSKDFAGWQSGEQAPLPNGHSGDGRDLAVASRSVNGHDVVHITQGFGANGSYGRYHLRAVVANGHVSFEAPKQVNQGGDTPPDGAATVILPDGTVLDSTGWEATPGTPPLSPCGNGDVDVYTAGAKEDGASSFGAVSFNEQVLWCVGNHVNARQLLALDQTTVHLYEDGGSDAAPVNILMNLRDPAGAWSPVQKPNGMKITPPSVFKDDQPFGLDDWTGAVAGATVHAVRRLAGSFEHRVLASGGAWMDGAAIPLEPTLADSGLFLAPYGDGLILVALSAGLANKVRYTAFDGAAWSAWATLVEGGASRSYLGGFAPPPPARPAIIWTDKLASGTTIAGALVP